MEGTRPMNDTPFVLGIWDGHDSGAALIKGDAVVFAVNEERLSRRKLEVGFPNLSIKACIVGAGLTPKDITLVSCSTADVAKTLTRLFPFMKERHYQLRRRKVKPPLLEIQKQFKFLMTTMGAGPLSKSLSSSKIREELGKRGLEGSELHIVDHHAAHAACAAFCSPFDDALIITLDGLGDGLSGSISIFEGGKLSRIASLSARDSLGVFFEQVTYLLNMRELEDEGKVMALSDYCFEIPAKDNLMHDFFEVYGLGIKAKYPPMVMFRKLSEIVWKQPWEMTSRMAQDVLETNVLALYRNAIAKTGKHNVAWAGGIASNIKLNMKIRHLEGVENWFVFPHMGDGGLAMGAALLTNYEKFGISRIRFPDVYFGQGFTEDQMKEALEIENIAYTHVENIEAKVAELLNREKVVLWFQGRGEFGPRALGDRSILAPAHSLRCKEDLNLFLKRRNWFQPFCPSMLKEDAPVLINDYDGKPSQFMTMAYVAKDEVLEKVAAVIGKDGSLRPQIVEDENPKYRKVIEEVKKLTGFGIILNTSFNRHGEPLVNSPADALRTFKTTGCEYLVMGNYLIERR
jgi:carbamoyltransferase